MNSQKRMWKTTLLAMTALLMMGSAIRAEKVQKRLDPSARLQKMSQELNLTAEQQAQLKKIMDETRSNPMETSQKIEDQILAVLNDQQKAKYTEVKTKGKEEFKKHGSKKSGSVKRPK